MDLLATIGPSSWDPHIVTAWLRLGVTGIRFPFSKLQPPDHVARCRAVREIAAAVGVPVVTMADLPGGKPRLNAEGPVQVERGTSYTIAVNRHGPPAATFWVEPALPRVRFRRGDEIIIGDGENRFVVEEVSDEHIVGTFAASGTVAWRRAFTPVGRDVDVQTFTERDRELATAARSGRFDWLALSYVESGDEVNAVRAWLLERLDWTPSIVAKVETRAAVEHIDDIVAAADAVMIGRGDLAIQIGFEELWAAQAAVVNACARARRYSIAATGFLESLAASDTPTRAECVDFCAAVEMGADAVLFATETALGRNPVLVIETARRLAATCHRSRGLRQSRDVVQ